MVEAMSSSEIPSFEKEKRDIPKSNVLHTAPVFFVNSQKEEKKRPFEIDSQRSGSISLNYGERRLSNILSDTKPNKSRPSSLNKNVLLEQADSSRGLFGDGNVHKRVKVEEKKKQATSQEEPTLKSASIRVFGFPLHLTNDLKRYFEKYGNVVECKQSLSNWITVTFDNPATALHVLKNNNTEIYGHCVRIIPHSESTKIARHNVISLEESKDLLKQDKNHSKLGQGKEGITAFDGQTNYEGMMRPVDNGLIAKLKETFFGW